MNADMLRAELVNMLDRDEDFVQQRIQKLIDKVDADIEERNKSTQIHDVFRVIEEYRQTYINIVSEFTTLQPNAIQAKTYKTHEALCVLMALSTLLTSSSISVLTGATETDPMYKQARQLQEYRDFYKSEKIVWQSILKSLTARVALDTENKKLKLAELQSNKWVNSVDECKSEDNK